MEYKKLSLEPYHVHLSETAYTEVKDEKDQLRLVFKDELVFNLDRIAAASTKKWNNNNSLKSCDAFYENNGNHYYIEFKNQPLNNVKPEEIRQKAFNSLLVTQIAIFPDSSFSEITKRAVLIVVYRESSIPSWEKIRNSIGVMAKKNTSIQFGLEKYKSHGFFQEIYTVTVEKFNEMSSIFQ